MYENTLKFLIENHYESQSKFKTLVSTKMLKNNFLDFLLGSVEVTALCFATWAGGPHDGTNSVAFTLSFDKLLETSWSQLSGAPPDDIFPVKTTPKTHENTFSVEIILANPPRGQILHEVESKYVKK